MFLQVILHNDLINHYETLSWKEKLNFINTLMQNIKHDDLPYGQKYIENSWIIFLKEKNLNILLKIIQCLQLYLMSHDIKNLKIKRQIIQSLMNLAKMNKQGINESIVRIICILVEKEKENQKKKDNYMIQQDLFNSTNHPTFLTGDFYQTQTNCQMEIEHVDQQKKYDNFVIKSILEITQRCQKYQFRIGLQIGKQLINRKLLKGEELALIYTTFRSLREIISARKQTKLQKEVDSQISTHYEQFTQAVFSFTQ